MCDKPAPSAVDTDTSDDAMWGALYNANGEDVPTSALVEAVKPILDALRARIAHLETALLDVYRVSQRDEMRIYLAGELQHIVDSALGESVPPSRAPDLSVESDVLRAELKTMTAMWNGLREALPPKIVQLEAERDALRTRLEASLAAEHAAQEHTSQLDREHEAERARWQETVEAVRKQVAELAGANKILTDACEAIVDEFETYGFNCGNDQGYVQNWIGDVRAALRKAGVQ